MESDQIEQLEDDFRRKEKGLIWLALMLCALLRARPLHPVSASFRHGAGFGSRTIYPSTVAFCTQRSIVTSRNMSAFVGSSSALPVPQSATSLRGRNTAGTRASSSHSHSHSHSPFGHSHSHSHAGDTDEAAALAAAISGAGDKGSRIILLGLASNVALTIAKGLGGVFLHSASLLADAGHSLSDLLGDLVVLFSWKLSRRPASKGFQFGYGKFEALGSLLVASLLVGGALGIGQSDHHPYRRARMLNDVCSQASIRISSSWKPCRRQHRTQLQSLPMRQKRCSPTRAHY